MMDVVTVVDINLVALTEPDRDKRAALIEKAWAEDGSLTDPPLVGVGYDGLHKFAETVCEHYAGQKFRRVTDVDVHHDRFRYEWELVAPDETVTVAGIDVGDLAPDGRLHTVTGFFGKLPRT
ncbi:MAG TPA: hypothetical protein VG476_03620 [Acidimicrobiales bacterium]|nr:hypothetical protein [Acidimicrobiales bacterium]